MLWSSRTFGSRQSSWPVKLSTWTLEGAVGVGDTNGDGFADILISVQETSAADPNPFEFAVILVLRRASGNLLRTQMG